MKKNIFTAAQDAVLPDEELGLINRHTLRDLTRDEVFCFTLTLCDNRVDRDMERFEIPALHKLAELFDGRTGIADHSMKSEDQMARIYKTWVEEDPAEQTMNGEPYTCLKAKAYMPVTEETKEKIAQIKSGIKKETSVSCSVSAVRCSICGSNWKEGACRHRKGRVYDGKVCHGVLTDPTDAYEWSFVAVPAQRSAGVTKSLTLAQAKTAAGAGEEETVTLTLDAFKGLTACAERFRQSLIDEVIRSGLLALPDLGKTALEELCGGLNEEQLERLGKSFRHTAAERFPLRPQLSGESGRDPKTNHEFII